MASPAVDGNATNKFSTASSGTVTLSTTQTNDVILVWVGFEPHNNNNYSVSSVTASGLTFTKYGSVTYTNGTFYQNQELWWAPASGVLTSEVITVTLSHAIDCACIVACGVSGAHDFTNPWDSWGSFPVTGTDNGTTNPTLTFDTLEADDLILFSSSCQSSLSLTGATGTSGTYASVGDIRNTTGLGEEELRVSSCSVSALQSGATVKTPTSSHFTNIVSMVVAITADAGPINVNATGVQATGVARAASGGPSANAVGRQALTTARALTPNPAVGAVGAQATGAAHNLIFGQIVNAIGVQATAIARAVIAGVSAIAGNAKADALAGQTAGPVALIGVQATGVARSLIAQVGAAARHVFSAGVARAPGIYVTPVSYLPVLRIMRNTAVPAIGAMSNAAVAVIGRLYPSGPQPRSLEVFAQGVQAVAHAGGLATSFNVSVMAQGVQAAGVARVLIPAA
jgi:hypothetical protein